jgi:hypothetical protein
MHFILWLVFLISLQSTTAVAKDGQFPWHDGDKSPSIAGIHLGDNRSRLDSVLGPPTSTHKLDDDGLTLTYEKQGIMVLYAYLDHSAVIYLLTRSAGNIGGIRIGDKREKVLEQWGPPSSAQGDTALYRAGDWVVVIKLDQNQMVVQLGIGRSPKNGGP